MHRELSLRLRAAARRRRQHAARQQARLWHGREHARTQTYLTLR